MWNHCLFIISIMIIGCTVLQLSRHSYYFSSDLLLLSFFHCCFYNHHRFVDGFWFPTTGVVIVSCQFSYCIAPSFSCSSCSPLREFQFRCFWIDIKTHNPYGWSVLKTFDWELLYKLHTYELRFAFIANWHKIISILNTIWSSVTFRLDWVIITPFSISRSLSPFLSDFLRLSVLVSLSLFPFCHFSTFVLITVNIMICRKKRRNRLCKQTVSDLNEQIFFNTKSVGGWLSFPSSRTTRNEKKTSTQKLREKNVLSLFTVYMNALDVPTIRLSSYKSIKCDWNDNKKPKDDNTSFTRTLTRVTKGERTRFSLDENIINTTHSNCGCINR